MKVHPKFAQISLCYFQDFVKEQLRAGSDKWLLISTDYPISIDAPMDIFCVWPNEMAV